MQIQTTAIIRDRGQLTIPEKIRKTLKWPTSNSIVLIKVTADDDILIRSYEKDIRKVDWDDIWKNIRKLRSFKIKNNLPASVLIAEDRNSH